MPLDRFYQLYRCSLAFSHHKLSITKTLCFFFLELSAAAMVSPDASTEGSGSTMDEREKRFYSRPIPSRQPPPSSQSQSQSSEHISNLPNKKKVPTTPSKPPPSSSKRSRNEDEKTKKPKEEPKPKKTKEEPKPKVKKPEPLLSSAKKPILWNPKDEIVFLKALISFCQDGKEFPKNVMTPVYDYVRGLNTLDYEYSNGQLGEKFRRLRTKFSAMEEKVKGGGYSFKTPHDESLYKLSKKIWGREDDEDESEEESEEETEDKDVKKIDEEEEEEKDGKEEENEVEMTQKDNDEAEEESSEDLGFPVIRHHLAAKEELNVVCNGNIGNGVQNSDYVNLIDGLRKENSIMMNEFKEELSKERKEFKSVIVKMVREEIQSYVNGKSSNEIGFSSKEVVGMISSARELPALDVSEARVLEQKWKRQHVLELEACSRRLTLLQEECQKRMKKLRSVVDEYSVEF